MARKDREAAEAPPEPPKIIRVLHGPNLNLLGDRDPEHYGTSTLAEIESLVMQRAELFGLSVEFFQSNHEGQIVDAVQAAGRDAQGMIINPGALSHYSQALSDAVAQLKIPVVEVHLSNPYAREEWRRQSVVSPVATAVIAGFRTMGYVFAIDAMAGFLTEFAAA